MSRAQFPDGKHRRPGCRPGSGSGACVRVQQSPPGVTAAHALGIPAPLKHPPNQRSMLQLRSAKHRLVLKRSDVAVSLRRLAARAADRLPLRRRRPASGAHLRSVDALSHTGRTDVDRYWSGHTVRAESFAKARQSKRFLEWRFDEYPLFREFSGLWGDHDGEVDPRLRVRAGERSDRASRSTRARDGSWASTCRQTALDLAGDGWQLHGVGPDRVELVPAPTAIRDPARGRHRRPFNCQGVLHHTSDPEAILGELARVLRPGGTGTIMVYNRDSVWFHLYTAYERMVVENVFPGADVHEAFRRNTDGPDCPISRSYVPEEFAALCGSTRASRWTTSAATCPSTNSACLERSWARAIADGRLPSEHREFLRGTHFRLRGRPMFDGRHAGIGGTYRLRSQP